MRGEEATSHGRGAHGINGRGAERLVLFLNGDGVLNQVPKETQGAADAAYDRLKRLVNWKNARMKKKEEERKR